MTEMIERVARKLAGRYMIDDGYGEEAAARAEQGDMWKNFRASAQVAIEAMREPTEKMKLAPPDVNFSPEDAAHAWRCMIDAALPTGHGGGK